MHCGSEDKKKDKLSELYSVMNVGQSIIFVNSRPGYLGTFLQGVI